VRGLANVKPYTNDIDALVARPAPKRSIAAVLDAAIVA
jgi:hypothetical protein